MVKQREHTDIVFAGLDSNPEGDAQRLKEKERCSKLTMSFNVAEFALVLVAAILFQVLYTSDDTSEIVLNWVSDAD